MAAQAAHSLEEYLGRLWEVFPPARFLTGLVATDLRAGFIGLNLALIGFGLWCVFWPVRKGWPSAVGLAWCWVVVETINGIVHQAWALSRQSYEPGVITAPILLALALHLGWLLRTGRVPARG